MEMNKSANKRKRIDVACPAQEDASSFYKRLGLGILDTSWKSEEAEPPRKRAVIAPQSTKPTPRPNRVAQQSSQPQQTARQVVHSFRNSVEAAAINKPQGRPYGYQWHHRTDLGQTRPNSRTESERLNTTQKALPAPLSQRVVKKEPQVKPINRYAPPEYVTLMYHPTPTLEDLGLTSYLDSPPSSPRSVSPDRGSEAKKPVSVAQQFTPTLTKPDKSEERPRAFSTNKTNRHLSTNNTPQGYTPSFAPKGWVPPKAVYKPSQGQATSITHPVSLSTLTSRPVHTAANTVTCSTMVEKTPKVARDSNRYLSTNTTPQGYTPSFAPKGWVPPKAVHKPSQGHATTVSVTRPVSQSALTSRPVHNSANTVTRPAMVPNLHKVACDSLSNDCASTVKTGNSFGGVTPHS